MLQRLVLLAAAGAVGTLARYGLAGLVQRSLGAGFPWGTLVVNVTGCLLAGLIWTLAEERLSLGAEMRTVAMIGFLGAFTTFSAFILETGNLARDSEWLAAAANLILQNVTGLAALYTGTILARAL